MKDNRVDLGILLTIATTSAGLWYYLLDYIISIATKEPNYYLLLALGWLHWAIFLITLTAIVAIYFMGVAEVVSSIVRERLLGIEKVMVKILFIFWLPT